MIQRAKGDFAIGTALAIRVDYTADDLRRLAKQSRDADWSRRLLALSVIMRVVRAQPSGIYWRGSVADCPRLGRAFQSAKSRWPEDRKGEGPGALAERQAAQGACEAVEKGPVPISLCVVHCGLVDPVQWLSQEHRICVIGRRLGVS